MSGRFNGLSDAQWEVLRLLLPGEPEKRNRGMPHASWRKVLNTILWVLITGCRWADIPNGKQWGKKSSSHRWLGRWMTDGTLERIKAALLGMASLAGKIDWSRASVDGSFSPWEGRGRKCRLRIQRQRGYHS